MGNGQSESNGNATMNAHVRSMVKSRQRASVLAGVLAANGCRKTEKRVKSAPSTVNLSLIAMDLCERQVTRVGRDKTRADAKRSEWI